MRVRRLRGPEDVVGARHRGDSKKDPGDSNSRSHRMQGNDTKNLHLWPARDSRGAAVAPDTLHGVLYIHRAARADALADALAGLLSAPSPDPLAPEAVAVPTRGMERWLTQRMSAVLGARPGHADGICANVAFPAPPPGHRCGRRRIRDRPAEDPWLPERACAAARGRGGVPRRALARHPARIWAPTPPRPIPCARPAQPAADDGPPPRRPV
jgi:hypothetical protein